MQRNDTPVVNKPADLLENSATRIANTPDFINSVINLRGIILNGAGRVIDSASDEIGPIEKMAA